jgi:hypothetical protein
MPRASRLPAFLIVAASVGLLAHHSASQFDFSKSIVLKGIVRKFTAMNPHMHLWLEIRDTKGKHTIELEGDSLTNLRHMGYRDGMVHVGEGITVYAAPMTDGSDGGYVIAAVTAKGLSFGMPDEGPSGLRH